MIYVGALEPASRAMGPGLRAIIWVRGCPRRCAGCITPEFIPNGRTEHAVPVATICEWIDAAVTKHQITGVSFSGGEPFAQAGALARVAHHAHAAGLTTLAWSGYTRTHLEGSRAPTDAAALLAELDVLIDGPFIRRLANNDPFRGSSNQQIHLLTKRHRQNEFETGVVETRLGRNNMMTTVGVVDYEAMQAMLAILGVQ